MGATTQAISSGDSWMTYGNRRAVLGTLTMSSSYATHGDTVTAAGFGLLRAFERKNERLCQQIVARVLQTCQQGAYRLPIRWLLR